MNRKSPTISVVVPTLNSDKTVKSCLDSIMGQEYPKNRLEVIIVDGGSRDRTLDLVAGHPVMVISESKKGRGAAYNRGFQEAKGDYVAFLDSDAIAPVDWLKDSMRIIGQDSSIAAVHFKNLAPADSSYFQKCVDTVLSKGRGGANGVVYKKSALISVGGFNVSLPYLQEDDVRVKMVKQGYKVLMVDKPSIWHYPRKNLKSYLGQCFESGIGLLRLYFATKRPRFFAELLGRILVAIFPLFSLILFSLSFLLGGIALLLTSVGALLYAAYLWRSTDQQYRFLKYILPGTFLMWVSTLGTMFGYVVGLFEVIRKH